MDCVQLSIDRGIAGRVHVLRFLVAALRALVGFVACLREPCGGGDFGLAGSRRDFEYGRMVGVPYDFGICICFAETGIEAKSDEAGV